MTTSNNTFNLAACCLAENAARRPGKTALILAGAESDRRLTYGQLDLAVRRLATGFSSLGLPPGARVLIRLGNDLDYALSFFALIAAGLVALPASAQLTAEEVDYLREDSGATAVICPQGLAASSAENPSRSSTRRNIKNSPPFRRATMPPPRPTIRPISSTPLAPPAAPRCAARPARDPRPRPMLDHWLA